MSDILDKLNVFLEKENISKEDFFRELSKLSLKRLNADLCLDESRKFRTGIEEVVFAKGKSVEQLKIIIENFYKENRAFLITKLDNYKYENLNLSSQLHFYSSEAELLVANKKLDPTLSPEGDILVVCAGSSDVKVGLEAYYTGLFFDYRVGFIADVGIAGLHRLEAYFSFLEQSRVIIAVAGMEGALPSVLAGLLSQPIIGVPTSVGYGTHFQGVTALLAMLNSCAPGLGVVNIDNGFGAMVLAGKILNLLQNVKE